MNFLRTPPHLRPVAACAALALGCLAPGPRLAADVNVYVPGPVNLSLPRQYTPGSSVNFVASAPAPAGTCQWLHDGAPIAGATAANLTIDHLTPADTGNYQLQVTSNGSVDLSTTLTLNVLPFPASPVDLSFTSPFTASPFWPAVLLATTDGSLIVRTGNDTATPSTVRLHADGSLDASFVFPATAGSVIAELPNHGLLTSAAPYRLNPDGSAHPLVLPAGFDSTQPLTGGAVQPDGKIILAQGHQVARLNIDDSVDSTFAYSGTLSPLHSVLGFRFDSSGRLYVTATEVDPVAGHFPSSWTVVYRLAATGAEDAGFPQFTPPLLRGGIAVYPLGDGRLLRYSSYEGIVTWTVLNDDGSVDRDLPASSNVPDGPIVVDQANLRIFYGNGSIIHRAFITATAIVDDPTFYQGSGYAGNIQLTPSGQLLVSGNFTQWDDHVSPSLVRLRTTDVVNDIPPVASIGPSNATPKKGSTLTLTSVVTGQGPLTYQWLALDGQPLPADTTSPQLTLADFSSANLGRYQLRVAGVGGTVLSNVTSALAGGPKQLPYLANLSGRAFVGTGDDTAIAGLAVKINAGALGLPTLLRGAGPALQSYGVSGFLPNPVLNLYSTTGQVIGNNDNCGNDTGIQAAASSTGAFPFPANSNDAAMLRTFGTGNTTLQLVDQANGTGIGLLEIYRIASSSVSGDIVNLSLRARTGPGEKVAIAGFVIVDPQGYDRTVRVLLRVVGPTLSQSGVAFPLADPVLTLYKATGEIVASNDNWSDGTDADALAATMKQVGAFALPVGSKDAALVLDLPPGVYSVQATGAGSATGVALTEIYLVR